MKKFPQRAMPLASGIRFSNARLVLRFLLVAYLLACLMAKPGRTDARAATVGASSRGQSASSSARAQALQPPQDSQIKTPASAAPAPTDKPRAFQEIQLTGAQSWADTGIDVRPGERIVSNASGTLRYADAKDSNGPGGLSRGFKDLLRILPFNGAGRGALIGRIGDRAIAEPFLVGAHLDTVARVGGRLAIGINQMSDDTGDGFYTVRVEIYPADPSAAAIFAPRKVASIPGVDGALFAKIPRRVADQAGDPGDMVNLLIIGSQVAMQNTFTAAGWVKVDTDVTDAVLHGVLESIEKQAYVTMPMSPLFLFGRQQDFGWAHAEPIEVVASRNHLRMWKAPFQVKGETLWVGAATHDIGFERDQRNNGVTHKIDPNVDLEREYVEKTLGATGLVSEYEDFLPKGALKEAKTATGGSFHSDGRVIILKLNHAASEMPAPAPAVTQTAPSY